MHKKSMAMSCGLAILGLAIAVAAARGSEQTGATPNPDQVIKLVQEAAELIETKGEDAFAAFREPNSKWFRDGSYVFVNTMSGKVVVCPEFPELEGKDEITLKDPSGRPIMATIIDTASVEPRYGWVHYQWPTAEGSKETRWKASYVCRATTPDGNHFIVGSGLFTDGADQKFFIEDTVNRAAERITADGDVAFPALRNPVGPFIYGTTSVFVFDKNGTELVSHDAPQLEGKNLFESDQEFVRTAVQKVIETLASSDSAWIEYQWPKPGQTDLSNRHSFIRKIDMDGRTLYVGAGLFE